MSFADSFWTQDYELGFKALFEQLKQGVNENDDFIQLFTKRMELELIYGSQLESIEKSVTKSSSKRQANDDYVSSIKNAYQKINENFSKQGEYHLQVASNIKLLVLEPFTKWCKEHRQRVDYSESVIYDKNKQFKGNKWALEKLQKRYFNKCRMLEEFKSHYTEDELTQELKDIEFAESIDGKKLVEEEDEAELDEENSSTYAIGSATYDHKSLKALLNDILSNIELVSHKVPILGTYHNVSTGSAITQWLLDNMPEFNRNIVKAEAFGQDLLNNNFIRLIGSMSGGKSFINSSQFYYQWKPVVFEITKLTNLEHGNADENNLSRNPSLGTGAANQFQDYFEDMKQAIGVNSVDFNDKTQLTKLIAEVNQLDTQYFKKTVELDAIRCEFEELIMDHLTFMQKCELDRLKAIKKVTFDFLSSFSNKIASMKLMCDELLLLEETINPVNDLKFLIENYSTGKFKPHVILYDNYYNSNIKQTFGVDLNVKARLDRKVVPILIQCILSHLDKVYPDIENDEERINLWTQPIHLTSVHKLRFQLNDISDPNIINDALSKSHPIVITNLLKLYFMELPDSVLPHNYYDLIKSLYSNYPVSDDSKTHARVNGLQNVLIDLPKCNLATLDAILTHLNRLVQIIGSKNSSLAHGFRTKLSKEFGNLILRPKLDSSTVDYSRSVINDKHQFNFINDLFEHKETIFKELRRANSTRPSSGSNSVTRENSTKSTANQSGSVAQKSKSRLETKLQNAVQKTKKDKQENKHSQENNEFPNSTELVTENEDTMLPSTPPPVTPKKLVPNSLKRSTSPNKKKLNTILSEDKKPSKIVVSSRPSRKDIIYDNNADAQSPSDFVQPKFISTLGRKTSVKDLATKFDSPAPESPTSERSISPSKRERKVKNGAVVVD
ncbi:uncharacterized protein CANTADRAFT_5146 [Suhomyces tanzawaensis NRRL Y-17324]|uniref:RhoGAP-domain-containing protein n=1 Tax=Suhomyces tanzawaensis NRRL Y-17324 TaxID=984487 RepID=A0A1E4SNT5_9ASCO|nr:uncharacterized protein CANTADRAFT_5146 [Suhomyces tanzawaensis NRRL Y-17324]ODV81184.1 hypothetical protein CANTADRAFT_5146 [Suhomyces tanzawaensis NRRL Y-17324]